MHLIRGRSGRAGAAAALCFLTVTTISGQAPTPGPLLTDPARGNLRMLLDNAGLGSGDVSIGERTYRANYTSTEHVHQGIEILYVLDGEFHHEINGRTYVLRPGMIGVVKVGDKVRHKTGPGPVRLLMIWVPGEEGARVAEGWVQPVR
jgi:mannose-6-phosphate isomerase-like protein (cupin superfamily)